MNRLLSTLLLLTLTLYAFSQGTANAGIALMIYDLDSSRNVVLQNADVKLTPASVMKLFTTATALELLGPDCRIHTVVTTNGTIDSDGVLHGNIYIRGALDPTIESSAIENDGFFSPLIDSLKAKGIRKIDGDIVADGSIVSGEPASQKWVYEDLATYYGVGCFGISLYDNVQKFVIKSGGIGQKRTFRYDYPETDLNIIDRITTVRGNGASVYFYSMPYSRDVLIEGQIGTNVTKTEPLAISDPVTFMARHLKTLLNKRDIQVTGKTREGKFGGSTLLYCYRSPLMVNITKEINYRSNNHFAQHIFRLLGSDAKLGLTNDSASVDPSFLAKSLKGATTADAVFDIKKCWSERDVDLSALTMYDGNGLSPMDAASARMIVDLLRYMWHSDNGFYFASSLPVCGEEGTVKKLFADNECFHVRAKSGSMSGVQSYAGYLTSEGHSYAFCIMVNEFDCGRARLRQIIENTITEAINNYEAAL